VYRRCEFRIRIRSIVEVGRQFGHFEVTVNRVETIRIDE